MDIQLFKIDFEKAYKLSYIILRTKKFCLIMSQFNLMYKIPR